MERVSEAQLISAYKNCFATDSGRIVLKHLLKAHQVFSTDFVEENTHSTSFNQGGKNVVLGIMRKLHVNEDQLQENLIDRGEEYVYEDTL